MSRTVYSVKAPAWTVVNNDGGSILLVWHSIPGERDSRNLLPLFTNAAAAQSFMDVNNKQPTRMIEIVTQQGIVAFLRAGLDNGCTHVAVFENSPADFSAFALAEVLAAASTFREQS